MRIFLGSNTAPNDPACGVPFFFLWRKRIATQISEVSWHLSLPMLLSLHPRCIRLLPTKNTGTSFFYYSVTYQYEEHRLSEVLPCDEYGTHRPWGLPLDADRCEPSRRTSIFHPCFSISCMKYAKSIVGAD